MALQLQVTAQGAKSAVQATAAAAAKQGRTSFKALDAMRNAAVFQVVWTVYASGRKFYIVFHMVGLLAATQFVLRVLRVQCAVCVHGTNVQMGSAICMRTGTEDFGGDLWGLK